MGVPHGSRGMRNETVIFSPRDSGASGVNVTDRVVSPIGRITVPEISPETAPVTEKSPAPTLIPILELIVIPVLFGTSMALSTGSDEN